MGYTNKTTHYELPQYVATDKPKYLTDFNETMQAIDTQMYTNAEAAATADAKAVAAKDVADGAVSSIGTLNTQINGDPQDPSDGGLNGQVSDNKSDIETMQALIGNGTPTTSNQTIIGAINGLEGAVAPREDGENLANSYTTGQQFARGGSVFTALTDLTAGTAFASLTLNTDYKNSDTLVEQIADAVANEGSLSDLETTDKSSLVAAINEANSNTGLEFGTGTIVKTGDGVKTYKEILGAIADDIAALSPSVHPIHMAVNISGGGTMCWLPSSVIGSTTNFETVTFGYFEIGSNVLIERLAVISKSTYNNSSLKTFDGSATTDKSTDVLPDGSQIILSYSYVK